MQKIFKRGQIQNFSLTLDHELNIMLYWMPSYVITCRSYKLFKMVRFFWPTLCMFLGLSIVRRAKPWCWYLNKGASMRVVFISKPARSVQQCCLQQWWPDISRIFTAKCSEMINNVLKHLCDVLSGSACTPPTILHAVSTGRWHGR